MNDDTKRPTGDEALGVRLDSACSEGRRLRAEHRETSVQIRRTMDALNQFSFTRADGLDVDAPLRRSRRSG